jgi:murein DD-endopeptidase MepM/ murein hydrolase activator NlpD
MHRLAAITLALPFLAGSFLGPARRPPSREASADRRSPGGDGQADLVPVRITTDARALQPGELVLVTLSLERGAVDVSVRAFGRKTAAFSIQPGVWQALVGIDLDQPAGAYPLTAEAHAGSAVLTGASRLMVQPKRFSTRTLRVAPEFVNPPPSLAERIARDAQFLQEVYADSAAERLWWAPFAPPVADAASSRFGTRSVFNGERSSPHAGTDFLSRAGTAVAAPNAGRIVGARDLFYSGQTVIIDHGLGVFSTLSHLSRIDVREGERINAGHVIGLSGATGRVTGPHLHWSLRVGAARVDPLSVLALLGDGVSRRP